MKYFKNYNKTDKSIDRKINEFLSKIKSNTNFKNYIKTFGIVGPCARGQGFYLNNNVKSDIDFYAVTEFINPFLQTKLLKEFYKIFDKNNASLLIASPTIFAKPDLMFFEFCSTGEVLYGKKLKPLSINKISLFEVFRNIIYRSCFMFSLFKIDRNNKIVFNKKILNKDIFLYYYSKVIFGLGECFLLLNRTYVADNFTRNELIKNNKFAISISEFIEEHQKMHDFRYALKKGLHNKLNEFEYIDKAFNFIKQSYDIISKELFGCKQISNCKQFRKIKAKKLSFISTRVFFILDYFKAYRKIKINLIEEPFVKLNLILYDFVSKKKNNEKARKKIFEYWKTAGWFYHYM